MSSNIILSLSLSLANSTSSSYHPDGVFPSGFFIDRQSCHRLVKTSQAIFRERSGLCAIRGYVRAYYGALVISLGQMGDEQGS